MKRLLATVLSIVLIFGMLTLDAFSADFDSQKHYAGMGDYTVTLQSDPITNATPSDFGTTAANGKVWTDKSVTVSQDHFEVTLSALAQEYISKNEENTTSSIAADVVMILDLSASMQNNNLTLDKTTMTRTKAMIKAVNEALEIIMRANNNNRVLIYTYQSNSNGSTPVINEFLPLGHYANTSWSNTDVFSGNSGKYFNYSTSDSSGVITYSANLEKDGKTIKQKSLSTAYGTCTQHGILKGVQALASAIGQENKTVDRKPYVLLFTDGAPGNANKTWYDSGSTGCSFSHFNNSTPEISALTVLSAAYMKDTLDTAYRTYNGKDMGIEWFNIGLGVGSSELGTLFLQPWTIASTTTDNAKNLSSNIDTYTSGKYAAYASYASSYIYTIDSYLVDGGDDLQDAFTKLASRIEEETKTITSPIITVEGAVSDLTFTDTIGEGMSVSNICLNPDEDTTVLGVATDNTYYFDGYDTIATLTVDNYNRSVLTWNIPADEVAIFAFANRTDPTDGTYIAADPIRLTYDVRVTNPGNYEGETLYSNAAAKAEFGIPDDNTYYYEIDGTMKSASFAEQTKSQNVTGLSNYSTSYTTNAIQKGISVTATLGNNGKLSPAALLKKSAENSNVKVGTDVTFTLSVTNKGQNRLSNIILVDILPKGLTYKAGSSQNASVTEDNSVLTFTIPFISAGQTVNVTYDAMLDANSAAGETFTNTAAITRINEINIYDPSETTFTITAYHTYRVLYQWSGNIPDGLVLPTDGNSYAPNQTYLADTTYTDATVIETKDVYGNINGRYTFSGWADPNEGVMGDADITISGVWNYESVDVSAHRVFYTWSGEVPPDAALPTDGNTYLGNQAYAVDTTFTSETQVLSYDNYGNINGKYTFSGWADPNEGVMGDADITITGVWNYESVDVSAHRVFYTWFGEVPPDVVLPTDGNTYLSNQAYAVDTTFTSETQVLAYDDYGNINGKYTFSGWADPSEGIMGDADITISGVWNYESVDVSAHRVFYTWSGEVPPDAALPTDGNTYVGNQAYAVDTTFTSETQVLSYDNYGNINGKYTFSGWADPSEGVMGDEDITISGVWKFESLVPSIEVVAPEEPPTTESDNPNTGETRTMNWAFTLWAISATLLIFLNAFRKKKTQ